ncbi:MAG: hypothetical protein ACYCWW_08895, partial [Deltaproteobacteria bacterium]
CTLSWSPSPVNFGSVTPNVSTTETLTLKNTGQLVCDVAQIAVATGSDPGYALGSGQASSLTVPPGGARPSR